MLHYRHMLIPSLTRTNYVYCLLPLSIHGVLRSLSLRIHIRSSSGFHTFVCQHLGILSINLYPSPHALVTPLCSAPCSVKITAFESSPFFLLTPFYCFKASSSLVCFFISKWSFPRVVLSCFQDGAQFLILGYSVLIFNYFPAFPLVLWFTTSRRSFLAQQISACFHFLKHAMLCFILTLLQLYTPLALLIQAISNSP